MIAIFQSEIFCLRFSYKKVKIKIYKTVVLTVVLCGCHNDELHSLYFSPNIVRVIKSRRMRWAEHVTWMGRGEVFAVFWLMRLKGRDHQKEQGVGGRITLKWALGR
jgi:hypothetical protein